MTRSPPSRVMVRRTYQNYSRADSRDRTKPAVNARHKRTMVGHYHRRRLHRTGDRRPRLSWSWINAHFTGAHASRLTMRTKLWLLFQATRVRDRWFESAALQRRVRSEPRSGTGKRSSLARMLRLEMRAELKSVLSEAGTTTIYVTHNQTASTNSGTPSVRSAIWPTI